MFRLEHGEADRARSRRPSHPEPYPGGPERLEGPLCPQQHASEKVPVVAGLPAQGWDHRRREASPTVEQRVKVSHSVMFIL